MSEAAKTLTFLGVAIVVLVLALVSAPTSASFDVEDYVGEMISRSFDPNEARRLEIVRFDEETATLREFEVAERDGLWVLPSKDGYPADASQQMAEAATTVMDREILSVVSNSAADHEQYGVVDPLSPKLEVGQKGVGTRVTMTDINDDPLVDLIIGKQVVDADNQHYVRQAKRDAVYVIEIDPAKLSTDFEDWIEDDLLQINPWDIQQVQINDYSAELVLVGFRPQIEWDRRSQSVLRYNDSDSKWIAESLQVYDRDSGEFLDAPLAANEELDDEVLRELKNALDDLKIVDVEKKPSGLSANLKAGNDFLQDNEALSSLVRRGFAPVPLDGQELEILSSEGETICTMKNGVEYVLRFGNLQLRTSGNEAAANEADEADEEAAAKNGDDVNRYLFVMARFNEDAIERPELADLPALPEEASDEQDDAETDQDETSSDSDEAAADEESEDDASDQESAGEQEDEAATTETEDDADEDGELDAVIAERKRIETENQRKLDEYQEMVDEGQQRVKELNLRFGDWYYVMRNDLFQKVRLGRADIVKQKEASEEDADAESSDTDQENGPAAEPVSDLGAPGSPVPGLPSLPATGEAETADDTETSPDDEPATETTE